MKTQENYSNGEKYNFFKHHKKVKRETKFSVASIYPQWLWRSSTHLNNFSERVKKRWILRISAVRRTLRETRKLVKNAFWIKNHKNNSTIWVRHIQQNDYSSFKYQKNNKKYLTI